MLITDSSPHFPKPLFRLTKPPEALYFQGDETLLSRDYVAIVGAREVESWVEEWMEHELLPVLTEMNLGVVSGGARGVDQLAHRACLRAGRPTLVVLPSGCRAKYPSNLEAWTEYPNVGFISEYADDVTMRKFFFYKRNRIIAGLSPVILIIQASEKSGTMITAKYALDIGASIAALPGNPLNANFSGNNQLLFDGAQLIRGKRDLQTFLSCMFKR